MIKVSLAEHRNEDCYEMERRGAKCSQQNGAEAELICQSAQLATDRW